MVKRPKCKNEGTEEEQKMFSSLKSFYVFKLRVADRVSDI